MKTLIQSSVIALTVSAGLVASALAASPTGKALVNAYGEPAGFGNLPDVVVPDSPTPANTNNNNFSRSRPGTGGLFLMPGAVERRSFESLGSWQARIAAEPQGTVTIGTLEVLDSGPTGPMTPEAQDAANDEVTAQVLQRIKTTDHIMHSLKSQTRALPEDNRAQFQAAAAEVAQRREALRESLRTMRASSGNDWANARSTVAVNFNAYVESTHRAQAAAPTTSNS